MKIEKLEQWKLEIIFNQKVRLWWRFLPVGAEVVGRVKPLAVFGVPNENDIVDEFALKATESFKLWITFRLNYFDVSRLTVDT